MFFFNADATEIDPLFSNADNFTTTDGSSTTHDSLSLSGYNYRGGNTKLKVGGAKLLTLTIVPKLCFKILDQPE